MIILFDPPHFSQAQLYRLISGTFGTSYVGIDEDFMLWKDLLMVLTRTISGKVDRGYIAARTPAGELQLMANLPAHAHIIEEA